MIGNPNDHFSRKYPVGDYVHATLPNDYEPSLVVLPSGRGFACCISRKSLLHRTWYIHYEDWDDFVSIVKSGQAQRLLR